VGTQFRDQKQCKANRGERSGIGNPKSDAFWSRLPIPEKLARHLGAVGGTPAVAFAAVLALAAVVAALAAALSFAVVFALTGVLDSVGIDAVVAETRIDGSQRVYAIRGLGMDRNGCSARHAGHGSAQQDCIELVFHPFDLSLRG
jgi:hypothetical protein